MNRELTYGGIGPDFSDRDRSAIWLQSVPYDGTSTYGKGADRGFDAFIDASYQMELYDIETQTEVYREGIHILPTLDNFEDPAAMYQAVLQRTRQLLKSDKFLTFFGGEHSISIGILEAFREKYEDLTILQLDAHADLRPEYEGSPYNHACALHAASRHSNLIQVGIRSMDVSENEYLDPYKCYFAHEMAQSSFWMQDSISQMSDRVYITLDLDVFDPSIMPATGTPEPGGMKWYDMLKYLSRVFEEKEVVGFDIVELAPVELLHAPQFMVSKLYYKMLSYKFAYGK